MNHASNFHVTVIGGANWDIVGRSAAAFRRSDSNPGTISISPGGVGRCIAENLVRLGLRCSLISAFGDDARSRDLLNDSAARGIDVTAVMTVAGMGAPHYLCCIDNNGALVGSVNQMEAIESLNSEWLAHNRMLLDSSDMLIVDTNIPENCIAWLARNFGQSARKSRLGQGPILGLDTVSETKAHKARPYIGEFDFVKPNRGEAFVLLGEQPDDGYSPEELATRLLKTGIGQIYLSLGSNGLLIAHKEQEGIVTGHFTLPQVMPSGYCAINRSGAGDAACAAIAYGVLTKASIDARGRMALAASILCAASMETVSPQLDAATLMELVAEIERLNPKML